MYAAPAPAADLRQRGTRNPQRADSERAYIETGGRPHTGANPRNIAAAYTFQYPAWSGESLFYLRSGVGGCPGFSECFHCTLEIHANLQRLAPVSAIMWVVEWGGEYSRRINTFTRGGCGGLWGSAIVGPENVHRN